MDNLFQLIIFLVIIYSVFNVIFGKKKPQGTGPNIPNKTSGDGTQKPTPDFAAGDILEEVLRIKIPKTENEYKIPIPQQLEVPEAEKVSEVEIASNSEPELMDVTKEDKSGPEKVQILINVSSQRTLELKNKIKNPSSLRELYLISEILNKPKAFRG